jgi:histidinol-phosphate aminotransferase
MKNLRSLIRPLVRELHPYVYGEQPKIKGLVKLNTNENPFPPSPKVLRAIKGAADERLRLYPNPTAQPLREKLAKLHRCKPDNIIVGNGSDELLALAVRCFAEPGRGDKALIQYFTPSYSLYPVLADIHGSSKNAITKRPNWRNFAARKRASWFWTRPTWISPMKTC